MFSSSGRKDWEVLGRSRDDGIELMMPMDGVQSGKTRSHERIPFACLAALPTRPLSQQQIDSSNPRKACALSVE
jgi:hypothetical protein